MNNCLATGSQGRMPRLVYHADRQYGVRGLKNLSSGPGILS